ncbi:MAG: polysaccharide biosynthesis/export family protein [Bacteroidota bacterium]
MLFLLRLSPLRLIIGEAVSGHGNSEDQTAERLVQRELNVNCGMIKTRVLLYLATATILLGTGCVPYDSLLNYEQAQTPFAEQMIDNYKPLLIQPNDILHIRLSSANELAIQPFVMQGGEVAAGGNNAQGLLINGYLVSAEGTINYPSIGTIKVGGMSMQEAKVFLLDQLKPYFTNEPIVDIRLLNFNVSVNGEVASPGTFTVPNERLTVLEAVTLAGDFTSYSRRDSVMVIRESAGDRTFGYVDFNSPEIFRSPYFYLRQNDVVYVQPLRRKVLTVQDPLTRALTWVSAATGIAAIVFTLTRN